jgi:translation initiation factor eIF-2B subunit epsilon
MAKKGGGKGMATEMADYEVDVPLQAVLLADSFAQKFRPITLERPKVGMLCFRLTRIEEGFE